MAQEVYSQVGSGTLPFTRTITPPAQRGTQTGAQGHRGGTQVMVGNPEDLVAVDAWGTGGVEIGPDPVKIIGPDTNPLPRCREIQLTNNGTNIVHLGPDPSVSTSGFPLNPGAGEVNKVVLPLLHNNEVWARTETGTSPIHFIVL